jgi:hypothetical protein
MKNDEMILDYDINELVETAIENQDKFKAMPDIELAKQTIFLELYARSDNTIEECMDIDFERIKEGLMIYRDLCAERFLNIILMN